MIDTPGNGSDDVDLGGSPKKPDGGDPDTKDFLEPVRIPESTLRVMDSWRRTLRQLEVGAWETAAEVAEEGLRNIKDCPPEEMPSDIEYEAYFQFVQLRTQYFRIAMQFAIADREVTNLESPYNHEIAIDRQHALQQIPLLYWECKGVLEKVLPLLPKLKAFPSAQDAFEQMQAYDERCKILARDQELKFEVANKPDAEGNRPAKKKTLVADGEYIVGQEKRDPPPQA